MVILSLHTGGHDGTAAVFSGQDLLAAIQLERMTRIKGDGDCVPSAAIDEALQATGHQRRDVDVITLSRSYFPARYFTHWPLHKHLVYRLAKRLTNMGIELAKRGLTNADAIFDKAAFLRDHGFRSDVQIHVYDHHLSHALSALAYTNWNDALLYTADGGGDNRHWSHYLGRDGQLADLRGGVDPLERPPQVDSLGLAYGYAT